MPAPKKYPHQAQLDALYAHQGIALKAFSEEIKDEVAQWQRAWVEKGKPRDNQKLLAWSKEICQDIDEYISQYDVELEELEEEEPLQAVTQVTALEVEAPIVAPEVESHIEEPEVEALIVAPVAPLAVSAKATKPTKVKLSDRMSKEEQVLERLFLTGKITYTKKELMGHGFDPGFFGWTSTGWNQGKRYCVKKKKTDTVYTIVKL